MKFTTFQNEKVILKHGREVLVEVDDAREANKGKRMMVACHKDGFRTDYPLFYGERVQWDNPEWFSNEFKEKVREYSKRERNEIERNGLKIQGAIEFNG